MPFQHCGIVGLGLLGGSLALDLRARFPEMAITGVARRPETLAEAAALRANDATVFTDVALSLSALHRADLVVLCTPVQTIVETFAALAPILPPGCTVTDVGSTKRAIMNAARTGLPSGVNFIGGHPMAGSERAGLDHARPGLFVGATWALCLPPEAPPERAAALTQLVTALGARPLPISAASHDALVARTSHLPHVLAAVLATTVLAADPEASYPFVAGGFRDTTRVASGNPALWRDILLTNRDQLVAALGDLQLELADWKLALMGRDGPYLEALLSRAADLRDALPPPAGPEC